jgi:two-component system, chemotaxis family, response regulator PixH
MITILVVEDTPSERELICGFLKDSGYQVVSAADGQEAVKKLEENKPNLVITDLVMPGMSGLELCRFIKKNPDTAHIPVVACTSKNQELDKLWGMKQGVNLYLTKPFVKEELLQAMRSLVAGE